MGVHVPNILVQLKRRPRLLYQLQQLLMKATIARKLDSRDANKTISAPRTTLSSALIVVEPRTYIVTWCVRRVFHAFNVTKSCQTVLTHARVMVNVQMAVRVVRICRVRVATQIRIQTLLCARNMAFLVDFIKICLKPSGIWKSRLKDSYRLIYNKCLLDCSPTDVDCIGVCLISYNEDIQVCPCQSQCPGGCPCPEYECVSPRNQVLILNTRSYANVPIITNAAGEVNRNFNFSIDSEAQVYGSCSLTWQNELYVLGGYNTRTQISKMNKCRLEPVGELPFDHYYGDCVNVADGRVYVCFNSYDSVDKKKCRVASSPYGLFDEISLSLYDHSQTRIATNDGEWNCCADKQMFQTS